jgi:hypothetical protein
MLAAEKRTCLPGMRGFRGMRVFSRAWKGGRQGSINGGRKLKYSTSACSFVRPRRSSLTHPKMGSEIFSGQCRVLKRRHEVGPGVKIRQTCELSRELYSFAAQTPDGKCILHSGIDFMQCFG